MQRLQLPGNVVESIIDSLVLSSIHGHSNLKMVLSYAHSSEVLEADAGEANQK